MSENCNQSCSSCGSDCNERKEAFDFTEKPHELSEIKKVIGIVSGKGGVGKSLVTSLLSVAMNKNGKSTAILDADITGPSIPKAFGINKKATGGEEGIYPIFSKEGIRIMSINLLLENDTDPVVWRDPIIAGTVKQFWTDVIWGEVDYMFIDMPPGTGDVPLTVFQSLRVDGIIIVTSPQELVSMIVSKAAKMAEMMNIPVLGLVENMSYFHCPDNGKDYKIFGDSHIDEIAVKHNLEVLARIPIDPAIAEACDAGKIESLETGYLDQVARELDQVLSTRGQEDTVTTTEEKNMLKIAIASEGSMVTEHFGHCTNFNLYDTEDGKIIASQSIENPGHRPGFLPNFLAEAGVNVIISGGMGGGAIEIFNEKGIEVILGAQGEAEAACKAYLAGELESTGSVCHDHIHHGEEGCGGGCGSH